MPTVNTVLGPVETAELGFTLSHEHVGTNAAGLRHTYPEFLDREGLLEQAVAAMREAYQAGVRTMVEMSTFDLGRDIGLIQEVSRRSGVQLIAVTGAKANSTDGLLLGLPGVDPSPNFKQKIVQWCYDAVSPSFEPFVSNPIPAPDDARKVCYVIYVPESVEAPHFLNGRKGVYIRTDEFSQRFDVRLATYEEIQHLANRRAATVGVKTDLSNALKNGLMHLSRWETQQILILVERLGLRLNWP